MNKNIILFSLFSMFTTHFNVYTGPLFSKPNPHSHNYGVPCTDPNCGKNGQKIQEKIDQERKQNLANLEKDRQTRVATRICLKRKDIPNDIIGNIFDFHSNQLTKKS